MKKKIRCYIYSRVSTAIQVDRFFLDAQKDKLRKNPGVMIELNKGNMVYAIVVLIKVDVIKVENLGGFSDNLK